MRVNDAGCAMPATLCGLVRMILVIRYIELFKIMAIVLACLIRLSITHTPTTGFKR